MEIQALRTALDILSSRQSLQQHRGVCFRWQTVQVLRLFSLFLQGGRWCVEKGSELKALDGRCYIIWRAKLVIMYHHVITKSS